MFDYAKLSTEIEEKFGFKFSPQELGYLQEVATVPSPAGSTEVYAVIKGIVMVTVRRFEDGTYSLKVSDIA